MVDLIKENVKVAASSHTCIVKELASLEGGAEIRFEADMDVLPAGCPVAQYDKGKWESAILTDDGKTYAGFVNADPAMGFGILLHDVSAKNPVAGVMLVGVVDCAKSPIAYSYDLIAEPHGGITFVNAPTIAG